MRTFGVLTSLLLSAVALPDPACAAEVYRWVDEDGKIHFSDTLPAEETPVTTIELLEPPARPYDPVQDPYSILNQASRIHEAWLEIVPAAATDGQPETPAGSPTRDAAAGYAYSDDGFIRDTTLYYLPPLALARRPADAARRPRLQAHALEELELTGPQPYSINSSGHRERVERSQALPLVPPPKPDR